MSRTHTLDVGLLVRRLPDTRPDVRPVQALGMGRSIILGFDTTTGNYWVRPADDFFQCTASHGQRAPVRSVYRIFSSQETV